MRSAPAFRSLLALVVASCLAAIPTTVSAETAAPTLRQRARVDQVVDGDTIDVTMMPSGAKRTVRLVGIDTPEVYPKLECGGKKATASLRSLLPEGTRVKLTSDPTQTRNDQYGRLLRYVSKVSTGVDMNRKQVWRGWARLFVYNDDPFMRVAGYRKARQSAEAHDRGIWGLCG